MSAFYDQAFQFLIETEKTVYTNHPKDSGGPTKFGVTLNAYSSYAGVVLRPEDIESLTLEDAKRFYFDRYWKPLGCDLIASYETATALFDCGVLYGVGIISIIAQEIANYFGGDLHIDGRIGPESVRAINTVPPALFVLALHDRILKRIDFVVSLSAKNQTFRQGWINRANRLLTLHGSAPLNRVTV